MSLFSDTMLLARKDMRINFRDKTGTLLGFGLPLGLVAVFGFVMGNVGGGNDGMPRVDVALIVEDDGPDATALAAALKDSDMLDVEEPTDPEMYVRDGEGAAALIIPEGYAAGDDITMLIDPGRTMEDRLLGMALVQALFDAHGPDMAWGLSRRAMLKSGLPPEWAARIETIMDAFRDDVETMFTDADDEGVLDEDADEAETLESMMEGMLPIARTEIVPEGREQQVTYQIAHAVSGMTVMMLLFSLVGFARGMIEERDRGTLRRLLAAPIDRRSVLLAKFVTIFIVGMMLITLLFAFAAFAFDLDVVSRFDTLLVVSLATCAASTGFAVLIGAWAKTDKQADGVSVLIILLMASLGGCWVPLMLLPDAVQQIARFTMPYWSMTGYQGTFWYGKHWTHPDMLAAAGVLLGVAVALTLAATAVFKKRDLAG